MVSQDASNPIEELRKRRTTRIVQAVPLIVTGVDALGRPFQERTSSLIINCHGCRYQSKHYVLKNMWVTLEIPHPETGQPPRSVRGRVAWIQRPRTVRQLFQVAIELEIPGNVWGIAFPPEDWFAFPDLPPGAIPLTAPAPEAELHPEEAPGAASAEEQPTAEAPVSAQAAVEPPDNLRVFPAPTSTDASLQLARQVTRLLADAKQQIQAAAREAAHQAVGAESRISMDEWQGKFAAAREELAAEVSRAVEKLHSESDSRARASQNAAAEALQSGLPRWLAPQLEQLMRGLTEHLRRETAAHIAAQNQHAQSVTDSLRAAQQTAEESAERLRATASQTEALLTSRAEAAGRTFGEAATHRELEAIQEREALARTADELQNRLASAFASAEASWQERLAASLETANARVRDSFESALRSAAEQGAHALDQHAAAARLRLEEEAGRHAGSLDERSATIKREAEARVSVLRESVEASARRVEETLATAAQSASQLEQSSSLMDGMRQQALERFQSHLDEVLNLHRNELERRSEHLLEGLNSQVRSAFDDSVREAAARFEEQVRGLVQPHIAGAEEAVHRLAGGRSLLDAALTLQEDRVRALTDEAFADSLARFRENLGSVEKELHESAQTIVARNLTDLDARTSDLKHTTIEELFKSAEWYEKKAQTQLQHVVEKGVELAGTQLRERAGEISGVFATEIDHYSRNFVEHSQSQMEEVVRESFERARALFTEAAETTSAAFTDEIQRHARQELDGFGAELNQSVEESRAQSVAVRHALSQQMTAEQEGFLRRFQTNMSSAVEAGVAEAQQQVQGGLEQVLDSWRTMTHAHQEQMRNLYGQLGDQSVEQFRARLENVSNSWMLATVTTLDRQSRDVLAGVAHAAEEKLRETCTQVFANVGDALRERLKEIASGFSAPQSTKPTP